MFVEERTYVNIPPGTRTQSLKIRSLARYHCASTWMCQRKLILEEAQIDLRDSIWMDDEAPFWGFI